MKRDVTILRVLLFLYILFCLILAGLNQGPDKELAKVVAPYWHAYENEGKTLLILICGLLTYRITGRKGRNTMRSKNLKRFFLAALILHITLPIATGNPELYFFAMPLPWTTLPLQAGYEGSAFYQSHLQTLGLGGIRFALRFFWIYSALIAIGTVLLGRRLQCSSLCLFNGFAAEIFDPAIPLFSKKKRRESEKSLQLLTHLRIIYLVLALAFTFFWIFIPYFDELQHHMGAVRMLELFWYLGANLILAMAFWVAVNGRFYCHLCPLGTTLSALAKLGGMRIQTDVGSCIGCGACNRACPLSISIQEKALSGLPVLSSRCVGCGHCIDACPKQTLRYETTFLSYLRALKNNK